jgi:hypothetical protein
LWGETEYIGSFLVDHIGTVWGLLSPILSTPATSPLPVLVSASLAVLSLLQEVKDSEIQEKSVWNYNTHPFLPHSPDEQCACLLSGLSSAASVMTLAQKGNEDSILKISRHLP